MSELAHMASSSLLVEQRADALYVTLHRPERRNAMNDAMVAQLDAVLDRMETAGDLRVLVLRGAGGNFCSGMDLDPVQRGTLSAEQQHHALHQRNLTGGRRFARLRSLPQVVVTAVEGYALAGAIGLVCASDITLATADARFGMPEVRRGLAPAQIAPFVAERIGLSHARRLALTGEAITAPEALRIGLAHEICADAASLEQRVEACVSMIGAGGPTALRETKTYLRGLVCNDFEACAVGAAAVFVALSTSDEAVEGVAAFKERRLPTWASPLARRGPSRT
jgi:isohexenylglutaconyl-CoA hydratase